MDFKFESPIKSISIDAMIIRANGYKEDLGRISFWDKSLFKRLWWKIQKNKNGSVYFVTDPMAGFITTFLATLQVNTGRAIVTNRLAGGGTEPNFQAWGTNTGTAGAADTTLFFETYSTTNDGSHNQRPTGTATQQTTSTTSDTWQVVTTMTAAQAQTGAAGTLGGTITNAGLFDTNGQAASLVVATSGGNLYIKGDFTAIGLNSGDSIQFTDKIQYS